MSRRRFAADPLADPKPLIPRVYAYVAYRIGDGPEAEDVTGEVFARAVRYRDSYDRSKGKPADWLIGIARRCVDDALRERTKPLAPADADHRDHLEQATVDRLTVVAAVGQLGERDQELIALRYGADLSARQIARLLDMRTNSVEVALHRALARLRALVEESPEREPAPSSPTRGV